MSKSFGMSSGFVGFQCLLLSAWQPVARFTALQRRGSLTAHAAHAAQASHASHWEVPTETLGDWDLAGSSSFKEFQHLPTLFEHSVYPFTSYSDKGDALRCPRVFSPELTEKSCSSVWRPRSSGRAWGSFRATERPLNDTIISSIYFNIVYCRFIHINI